MISLFNRIYEQRGVLGRVQRAGFLRSRQRLKNEPTAKTHTVVRRQNYPE